LTLGGQPRDMLILDQKATTHQRGCRNRLHADDSERILKKVSLPKRSETISRIARAMPQLIVVEKLGRSVKDKNIFEKLMKRKFNSLIILRFQSGSKNIKIH
jgi:hypothetical protein